MANPFYVNMIFCYKKGLKMKTCKDCKKEKEISFFYNTQGECKECTKKRVKENRQKVGNKYDFSESGVIRIIYKTQKRNNRLRGHGEMPYTKDELKSWLYENGFKALYDEWVSCDHAKESKPSIDRINDFNGYSFDNIKLVTWKQNREHQTRDILLGIGTSGLRCKKLGKYLPSGDLVSVYVSYSSAVRDIGYSLEYQIKKGVSCRSGFNWKYIKAACTQTEGF
jgi:hypothetical protein